jgi:hypothetical protein
MFCLPWRQFNLWRFIVTLALPFIVFGVHADSNKPVGEAVFVSGEVWADAGEGRITLKSGNPLGVNTSLQTGENSFVYIRMVDGGFFILRSGSRARIVNYATDAVNPSNSRLRLDLEHGHARAISGEAARKSPESFRLNTPVAAIGVRGTDFTVSTNAEITRVTVSEGAVVVDKLSAGCSVDTLGPCRSNMAQILLSTDRQSLVVRRDESTLRRETLKEVDASNSPSIKLNSLAYSASTSLSDSLAERLRTASVSTIESSVVPQSTPVSSVPPPTINEPQQIFWGRWRSVSNLPNDTSVIEGLSKNDGFSDWPIFSLWRTSTSPPVLPVQGQWNFQLSGHESYFLTGSAGNWTAQSAQVKDASLSIDLTKRSFTTQLTIFNQATSANLSAQGKVDSSGHFLWEFSQAGNMSVQGLIAGANGNQAGYIYSSQQGPNLWATGATFWKRP